ncbi:MAG: DNA/RNA nuclease SfsA [Pseudomonadota bacterium]
MIFDPPLIPGVLVLRYKRFLADIRLDSGESLTVHCPNPGAMMGLSEPSNRVWISDSQNPKRKLRYTLELMEVDGPSGKTLVGINTNLPNKLAQEAIENDLLPPLSGYRALRREVRYGENSRIDILLSDHPDRPHQNCYVEVKNVHLVRQAGLHEFPDCVTARGAKHLRELAVMVEQGHRAVMLFVIQRMDGDRFSVASDIDTAYGAAFEDAMKAGVEALALKCQISQQFIVANHLIDIV